MEGEGRRRVWGRHGVRIVRAGELDTNTPQTPGMSRAAALEEEGVELEEGEPQDGEPEAARVGTVRDPGAEA